MLPVSRTLTTHESLAEQRIVQHLSEYLLALLENLVPVSHEEQPVVTGLPEALVVKRGHPGLARPGRSHDQIAVVPALSLRLDSREHLSLERLGLPLDAQAER